MGSDNELFRDQVLNPQSEGERHQVDKIKKFSENPDEILKFRKDLDNMSQGLAPQKEENSSIGAKGTKVSSASRGKSLKRRRYDKRVVKENKRSFFYILMNIFTILGEFAQKYRKKKNVQASILNQLANGSFLYPSKATAEFVSRDIIPLQEMLRPFMRAIYQYGWRNVDGSLLHKPFEFNLIAEFERLQSKRYLDDYLANRHNPAKAVERINHFIGYYFGIAQDPSYKDQLINALKRSITSMATEESSYFSGQNGKLVLNMAEDFWSLPIIPDLMVPLFESYLARPLTEEELLNLLELEEISSSEYFADPQLKARMQVLADKMKKFVQDKKKKIQEQLSNIQTITEALTVQKEYNTKMLLLVDFAANQKRNLMKGFTDAYDLFSYQKPYLSSQYFFETYVPLLYGELLVRKEPSDINTITIQLFDLMAFREELDNITASREYMQNFAEKFQTKDDIFEIPFTGLTEEQNYQIVVLNNVADQFFRIGQKLKNYLQSESQESKLVQNPVKKEDFGKFRSIYDSYYLHSFPNMSHDFLRDFQLYQKQLSGLLYETMAFCLQYTYYFEHQKRNYKAGDEREKTLKELVSQKSTLENEQNKLIEQEESI